MQVNETPSTIREDPIDDLNLTGTLQPRLYDNVILQLLAGNAGNYVAEISDLRRSGQLFRQAVLRHHSASNARGGACPPSLMIMLLAVKTHVLTPSCTRLLIAVLAACYGLAIGQVTNDRTPHACCSTSEDRKAQT